MPHKRKKSTRNSNAGKGKYQKTPAAKAWQKRKNKEPAEKKRRAKLNKVNRNAGTYGNKDKKDAAHVKSKKGESYVMQSQSKNRKKKGAQPAPKGSRPKRVPKLNKRRGRPKKK